MIELLGSSGSIDAERSLAILREVVETNVAVRAVAAAAAAVFEQPVGRVALAWGERMLVAPSAALPGGNLPLDRCACAAVLADGVTRAFPNLAADPFWASSDYVSGAPYLRFYAGAPLMVATHPAAARRAVGTLAVLGFAPGFAEPAAMAHLQALADATSALIEAQLAAARLTDTFATQERLGRQFRQAERMADIGSWRLTLADGRVQWSEQIYAIHEVAPGDHERLADALTFYPGADRGRLEAALANAMATGEPYDLELDFITATGRERRVRAMAEAEREDGQLIALIGVFQDITERWRLEQALQRRADIDALTELASRGRLDRELDALLAGGERAVAVILADLDNFKAANDLYGHAAGDDVLRSMATALSAEWLTAASPELLLRGGCRTQYWIE